LKIKSLRPTKKPSSNLDMCILSSLNESTITIYISVWISLDSTHSLVPLLDSLY
jgi:hypothetical protein